ncbi:hypothetical protein L6164_036870 [Bauhinia variegata]|uniref:Uncharacterized protein n=1 Tax=Bauhinia variegata TaxID=167791 RepID=A0ACB9KIC0_BAUVA|nr:hypothetical protein L6164_036870 [Bauhinia variegata]
MFNSSRDMGNQFSEPEASQSQQQPRPPPQEINIREARPGPARRVATAPVNRAKSQNYSETQPFEQQKFVPYNHEDISKEAYFSAGKSSFQKRGEQYYGGVSSDHKTSREAQTVAAQREATPSQGYRGKDVENVTVVKPRETQGLMQERSFKELKLPNNYQEILKHADSAIDASSIEKLSEKLHAGVFLDQKTKKYWLDKSYSNCFMLYARALSITWSENKNYWRWVPTEDTSGTMIDVAELKKVCWLEVHGRMDTKMLSPGVLYEVSFVAMLKDPAQGWEVPVNVRLALPGGKKQEHKENLIEKLRMQWMEIPVGQFVLSAQDIKGEMEISMYEYEGGMWKQGLIIKGVVIRAKN